MSRYVYEFTSVWHLDATPDDVYEALERLTDYPEWWPEVREVTQLSDRACSLVCRSTLPYRLRFVTTQAVRDPVDRILEASMTGDLEGFSRWTIVADADRGTIATFDEEVVAAKPLLRRLDRIARPAFRVNHTRMMRHGERGLRDYLHRSS